MRSSQHVCKKVRRRFTSENVTVRNWPALSMSFCKFAAITTISLPSTNPAPTNSAAIPSAESTPTANSNLMSLSSRFWFLNKETIFYSIFKFQLRYHLNYFKKEVRLKMIVEDQELNRNVLRCILKDKRGFGATAIKT